MNSFGKRLWCWTCRQMVKSKVVLSTGYQSHRCPRCKRVLAHYTIDGE